ncbi:hypothetical protein [Amycolatopsis thermoflava]|uniref:hypothetical protein n=1 Tax=Amycolatopsis thermoflava TaxID=84480 RepID=UPI0037FDE4D1
MEHNPRLRPLQPAEPVATRWLDADNVLLTLALAQMDCEPVQRAGLARAQIEVRRLLGLPV